MKSTMLRGPLAALVALLAAAAMLSGCGDKKDKAAGEVAATVDRHEIGVQQVEQVLQQQRGLRPEQAEAAGRQILERLIDQQLAVRKAEQLELDDDPRVAQALEAARREVLARAYLEKIGEGAARPSAEEVQKYYDERPQLFAQRRIYNLQELVIEARADQLPALREQLASTGSIAQYVEWLRANDFRFGANQAVRAAEQLPGNSLAAIARLGDGQALLLPTPAGATVVVRAGSREQPVTLEQARQAIEQQILAERRRKLAEEDLKALRASAKIEYAGRFAPAASAAAGAAPSGSAPR